MASEAQILQAIKAQNANNQRTAQMGTVPVPEINMNDFASGINRSAALNTNARAMEAARSSQGDVLGALKHSSNNNLLEAIVGNIDKVGSNLRTLIATGGIDLSSLGSAQAEALRQALTRQDAIGGVNAMKDAGSGINDMRSGGIAVNADDVSRLLGTAGAPIDMRSVAPTSVEAANARASHPVMVIPQRDGTNIRATLTGEQAAEVNRRVTTSLGLTPDANAGPPSLAPDEAAMVEKITARLQAKGVRLQAPYVSGGKKVIAWRDPTTQRQMSAVITRDPESGGAALVPNDQETFEFLNAQQ